MIVFHIVKCGLSIIKGNVVDHTMKEVPWNGDNMFLYVGAGSPLVRKEDFRTDGAPAASNWRQY